MARKSATWLCKGSIVFSQSSKLSVNSINQITNLSNQNLTLRMPEPKCRKTIIQLMKRYWGLNINVYRKNPRLMKKNLLWSSRVIVTLRAYSRIQYFIKIKVLTCSLKEKAKNGGIVAGLNSIPIQRSFIKI